jgi:hypothetical protein
MTANAISEDNRHTIYIIFRVYDLYKETRGLRVYLDPSISGELRFTAEAWSAVPGTSV